MKKLSLTLTFAVILMFVAGTAAGGTIYVDPCATGANDGSSWTNAYNYLQDALAVAQDGNDIWVAEGTYEPDENTANPGGTGNRSATFQLINGVGIYGGYAGVGAPEPNERNVELYETILSGDINTPGDSSDNSYHVVTGSWTDATAVLDGFTITAGNANGSNPLSRGGGMYNYSGSPTVTNCTFSGNLAGSRGGGMYNSSNSNPELTNCTFSGNLAGSRGGGMYNYGNSPTVTNCTFSGNSAGSLWGGGMYNETSSPTVTNCVFSGNSSALDGGGMGNYIDSNPNITNCTFSGNSADNYGGGMYNREYSSPTLTNCTFSGNTAEYYGGGMYNGDSSPTLANCILWGNTAPSGGSQIYNDEMSSPTVTYSDVQGEYSGDGNIDGDPLFVDADGPDDIAGTEDDNLRLSGGSPCIDAGDNNSVPADTIDLDGDANTTEPIPFDLDGDPRFFDDPNVPDTGFGDPPLVDMGAYERNIPSGGGVCGDVYHPYPAGDINQDCRVNFFDIAIVAAHWLECTHPDCE